MKSYACVAKAKLLDVNPLMCLWCILLTRVRATRGYATPATRAAPPTLRRRRRRRPPLPFRDLDFKTWSCPSVEVLKPRSAPGRTDGRVWGGKV
jgi:hypothetical protein